MHGTRRTLYIATEDAKITLLSRLTTETASFPALLKLDLISRLLCLRDCGTNSSNCGQSGDEPMIIDFRIESQSYGYVNIDLIGAFLAGNVEFNYTGIMKDAARRGRDEKLIVIKEALDDWKLLERIQDAKHTIQQLIQNYQDSIVISNDLERYTEGVCLNISNLTRDVEKLEV